MAGTISSLTGFSLPDDGSVLPDVPLKGTLPAALIPLKVLFHSY